MTFNEISTLLNTPPTPAWQARQALKNLRSEVTIARAKVSHWERIVAERGEVGWLAVKYASLEKLKADLGQAKDNLNRHSA